MPRLSTNLTPKQILTEKDYINKVYDLGWMVFTQLSLWYIYEALNTDYYNTACILCLVQLCYDMRQSGVNLYTNERNL